MSPHNYKPGFILNSVFSSIILMVTPALYFITRKPVYLMDGSPSPTAGWVLFLLSPIIILSLTAFFYVSSRILFSFKKLNLINHEIVIFLISASLSFLLTPFNSLLIYILLMLFFCFWFSTGTVAWHLLEKKRYNKFKNENYHSLRSFGRANARPF